MMLLLSILTVVTLPHLIASRYEILLVIPAPGSNWYLKILIELRRRLLNLHQSLCQKVHRYVVLVIIVVVVLGLVVVVVVVVMNRILPMLLMVLLLIRGQRMLQAI